MSHHQHRRQTDDLGKAITGPPLSADQLEFFTAQTEHAVRKALRIYSRRAALGFAILFLAFLGNLLYSNHVSGSGREQVVRSGNLVAVDGCNRDFRSTTAVRGVLVASKDFTRQGVNEKRLTPEEGQLRLNFYSQLLEGLPLPDCRKADDFLTDNPKREISVPEPLYPQPVPTIVPPVSGKGKGQKEVRP